MFWICERAIIGLLKDSALLASDIFFAKMLMYLPFQHSFSILESDLNQSGNSWPRNQSGDSDPIGLFRDTDRKIPGEGGRKPFPRLGSSVMYEWLRLLFSNSRFIYEALLFSTGGFYRQCLFTPYLYIMVLYDIIIGEKYITGIMIFAKNSLKRLQHSRGIINGIKTFTRNSSLVSQLLRGIPQWCHNPSEEFLTSITALVNDSSIVQYHNTSEEFLTGSTTIVRNSSPVSQHWWGILPRYHNTALVRNSSLVSQQ